MRKTKREEREMDANEKSADQKKKKNAKKAYARRKAREQVMRDFCDIAMRLMYSREVLQSGDQG